MPPRPRRPRRPGPRGPRRPRGPHPRRPFPPPPPPRGHRHPVAREMQRQIADAHQLFEEGQYEEAGRMFHRLSQRMEEAGIRYRAAMLAARAAHAAILASQLEEADRLVKRAIRLHTAAGDMAGAMRVAQRAIDLLIEQGHTAEGHALKHDVEQSLKELGLSFDHLQPAPVPKKSLPAKCESCRGPVRPDEVRWLDDDSAECAYCGSVLKTE